MVDDRNLFCGIVTRKDVIKYLAELALTPEALIARALEQTEKVMVRYDGGC